MKHVTSVSLGFCLSGGSAEEDPKQIGLTHLLEHMLFKRTKKRSTFDLACEIDCLGGEINACTDTDELVLYGEVAGRDLSKLFILFAELLLDPAFTEEDLVLEKEVVKQEIIESFDDPDSAAFNRLSELFWPGSSFGMPVFGRAETVASFSLLDVYERLENLLVGNRVTIVAAGDFNEDQLRQLVSKLFGELESGVSFKSPIIHPGAGVDRIIKDVEQVQVALAIQSVSPGDLDYPKASLLSCLLGGGMSSRLFQDVREKLGLAYEVGSEIEASKVNSMFLVQAATKPENAKKVVEVIDRHLLDLGELGPSREEWERSIAALTAQCEMEEGVVSSKMWRMLETFDLFGDFHSAREQAEQLRAVSFDGLRDYCSRELLNKPVAMVLAGAVKDIEDSALEKRIVEKGKF